MATISRTSTRCNATPADDEADAGDLPAGGDLRQHDHADDGGDRRQERDHERVGRAREASERELIGHVRDHGGRHPHADACRQRQRTAQRRDGRPARQRRHDDGSDQHRGREPVDATERGPLGDAIGKHDVEREEDGVGERERHAERLDGDLDAGHEVDPDHRERERCEVAARARSQRRQADDRQELDRRDRRQRLPADREIEAAVHQREDAPPGQRADDGRRDRGRRTRARGGARRRRSGPPKRCAATRRRAPPRVRTAARRRTGRGSGRPR